MNKYLSDQELQNLFEVQMGWGSIENVQANRIFNFLLEAHTFTRKNHTVLDLGAGQLRYKPFVQHADYFGIDFAQGDSTWDYSKLDIIADICSLPLKDQCAEAVLNMTTLEHIHDPQAAINEMFRVLVPGGRLFLYAPFSSPMHQAPHDYFRFSRFGLEYLFKQAGFNIRYIKASNSYCYTSLAWFKHSLDLVFKKEDKEEILGFLGKNVIPEFNKYEDSVKANDYEDEAYPLLWMCDCMKPGKLKHDREQRSLNDIIACPKCKIEFKNKIPENLICEQCGTTYSYLNSIPNLCKP